jgi:phage baseplate assembly protein V
MFGRGASGVGNPEVTDAERRAADAVKFGHVHEVDYAKARVRVLIGDEDDEDGHQITGWLPMAGGRASGDADWHPLEVDERVVVLSEAGELQNGIVLPAAIYSDETPAPGDKAGLWRKIFADGASIEYDRDTGAFLVEAISTATLRVGESSVEVTEEAITLTVGGVSMTISGEGVAIEGGSITHDGKNIGKDHKHSGVQAGGAQSGEPV